MSHRLSDGTKVNQWGGDGATNGNKGEKPTKAQGVYRPSHKVSTRRASRGHAANGDTLQADSYEPPTLANPGCLVKGIKVGGGLMGAPEAHENEAPFPLKLAQWFIRSWCPPNGLVLDPFSGSGTTCHAAATLGRRGIGCDLRMSQCELGRRRCASVQPDLFQ